MVEGIQKAKVEALRSLELDDRLAEAYACLGRIAIIEWDLQRARAECEMAMRLNPNLAEPVILSARTLSYLSLHEEAIERVKHAGTTDLVSRRADGRVANQASGYPAISGDGSIVAVQSLASDLLCVTRCAPAGRDINLVWDVFVFDRRSGEMIRASTDAAGEWMETSRRPSIDERALAGVFLAALDRWGGRGPRR
jgi:hypothetical protein